MLDAGMTMRILTCLLLAALSASLNANNYDFKQAEFKREHIKSMSVVAPKWEDFTNSDGTGLYWEVIQSIYEPAGIKVSHKNIPWNRAMKMVTKYRTYNAIVGEYRETEEDLIFPTYPIDVEYMSVISLKKTGQFEGYGSLTGKTVGWIKDYDVIPESQRDFKLKEFRKIDDGLKLLQAGKIDFLIDESDEITKVLERAKLNEDQIHWGDMPEGTDVYVAFSVDNLSRELIEIYNERVYDLMQDGKMEAIYKKWDVAVPSLLVQIKE